MVKEIWERHMDREWNENQLIYRPLRDRVVAMILDVDTVSEAQGKRHPPQNLERSKKSLRTC